MALLDWLAVRNNSQSNPPCYYTNPEKEWERERDGDICRNFSSSTKKRKNFEKPSKSSLSFSKMLPRIPLGWCPWVTCHTHNSPGLRQNRHGSGRGPRPQKKWRGRRQSRAFLKKKNCMKINCCGKNLYSSGRSLANGRHEAGVVSSIIVGRIDSTSQPPI